MAFLYTVIRIALLAVSVAVLVLQGVTSAISNQNLDTGSLYSFSDIPPFAVYLIAGISVAVSLGVIFLGYKHKEPFVDSSERLLVGLMGLIWLIFTVVILVIDGGLKSSVSTSNTSQQNEYNTLWYTTRILCILATIVYILCFAAIYAVVLLERRKADIPDDITSINLPSRHSFTLTDDKMGFRDGYSSVPTSVYDNLSPTLSPQQINYYRSPRAVAQEPRRGYFGTQFSDSNSLDWARLDYGASTELPEIPIVSGREDDYLPPPDNSSMPIQQSTLPFRTPKSYPAIPFDTAPQPSTTPPDPIRDTMAYLLAPPRRGELRRSRSVVT
ncbi:hypothetical protein BZG36_03485 [Bifiguratus adelaidae]|uniref:MARVEL domain-containing protein n=1 Tax=Bifiguratus adelaidae TaxID=1938954 RepID=A0A261XWS7_9FUNG|nr:hypothetical protein BZG36_03485 [Bifiguratus adelaidae]